MFHRVLGAGLFNRDPDVDGTWVDAKSIVLVSDDTAEEFATIDLVATFAHPQRPQRRRYRNASQPVSDFVTRNGIGGDVAGFKYLHPDVAIESPRFLLRLFFAKERTQP